MNNIRNYSHRDWDAELERAKERAHGLVQSERISTPDMRPALPASERKPRMSARTWAAVLGLLVSALSYGSVSLLLDAPAPERVSAAVPRRAAARLIPPPSAAISQHASLEANRPATATPNQARDEQRQTLAETAAPRTRSAGQRLRSRRRLSQMLRGHSRRQRPASLQDVPDLASQNTGEASAAHPELSTASPLQPSAAALTDRKPLVSATATTPDPSPAATPAVVGQAQIEALEVSGPLATSSVRRALLRLRPQYTQCYRESRASARDTTVRVEALIDEMGRVRTPRTQSAPTPAFARCIAAATTKLVADAPDTGTVSVTWQLHLAQ